MAQLARATQTATNINGSPFARSSSSLAAVSPGVLPGLWPIASSCNGTGTTRKRHTDRRTNAFSLRRHFPEAHTLYVRERETERAPCSQKELGCVAVRPAFAFDKGSKLFLCSVSLFVCLCEPLRRWRHEFEPLTGAGKLAPARNGMGRRRSRMRRRRRRRRRRKRKRRVVFIERE